VLTAVPVRFSSHFCLERRMDIAVRLFNRRAAEDAELHGVLPNFSSVTLCVLCAFAVKSCTYSSHVTAALTSLSSHFCLKKRMDSAVRVFAP
jgi:hypothetical protein